MSKLKSSPQRGSFQKKGYEERLLMNPNDDAAKSMMEFYQEWGDKTAMMELDPEWQKNNMEYDLRTSEELCDKVKESDVYAQNLYAAMCNNNFQKLEVIPILKEETWTCSWRHAGGIIADMKESGDYIDWYCSGIRDNGTEETEPEGWDNFTEEQQHHYKKQLAYVPEAVVTDEIRQDLRKIGWAVKDE